MIRPGIANRWQGVDAVVCLGRMPVTEEARRDIESRVKCSALLFKTLGAKWLILSGGKTFNPSQSEAAYMQTIAIALGVPKGKILLEEQSQSTYENAVYTKALAEKRRLYSLAIVTSNYHIYRTKLLFNKLLPRHVLKFFASSYPLGLSFVVRIAREIPHIIRMVIFGLYR